MSDLTLVPAGAGSGKTHRIKTTLTEWVLNGTVRPERILAVTYTEAAAAELRGRIRASLIEKGLVEAAIAVEQAYVSTIHGLGLRLLTEHAFAAGTSPRPRLLEEAEEQVLIRQEIARIDHLDTLAEDPERYGYKTGFGSGASREDGLRGKILDTVHLLRRMGPRGRDTDLADIAVAAIRETYGPTGDGQALGDALHRAVTAMLAEFPEPFDDPALKPSPRDEHRKYYQSLRLARKRETLDASWKVWQALRKLGLKPTGVQVPERYKALAEAVMAAAEGLVRHPGPLDDACHHATALISGGQAILDRYTAAKRAVQAIDYADMIADAERLLAEDDSVVAALMESVDCVIIDEFQDTNPIQFAFLWRLAQLAPRTLIVGDLKQAIMGFQGADARLMEALIKVHPDRLQPLLQNWRSDARIMEFVNALGPELFCDAYQALTPTRPAGKDTALEILSVEKAGNAKERTSAEYHLAARLKTLIEEDTPLIVTRSGETRPLTPSDIAVLCPTHKVAEAHAQALRLLGIPVRINAGGWLEERIVQVALHALTLATDPGDRHAALSYAVLGPPGLGLEAALKALLDGSLTEHPGLAPLMGLDLAASRLAVAARLEQVLAATGLRDWLNRLDDPPQARANLLRLEHEARAFDSAEPGILTAQGFHGNHPKSFAGWLAASGEDRDFNRQPHPGALDAGGIELVTWHSAKGREWPVVAVTGLAHDYLPRALTLSTRYDDFSVIDAILDGASLRFTPGFAALEQQDKFLAELMEAAEDTARRLVYVAVTRPRDRLIIVWPEHDLASKTIKPTYARLLAKHCGMQGVANTITIGGKSFPARLTHCPKGFVPPAFEDEVPATKVARPVPGFGRSGIIPDDLRPSGGPLVIRPSSKPVTATVDLTPPRHRVIGNRIDNDGSLSGTSFEKGTVLHEAMRFLLTDPALKPRLQAYTGLSPALLDRIEAQAKALAADLAARGYTRLNHEIPFRVDAPEGGQYQAIIDCLAEGADGFIIIDHKSDVTEDIDARFETYRAQLLAYRDMLALARPDKSVKGMAIFWIGKGVLSEI